MGDSKVINNPMKLNFVLCIKIAFHFIINSKIKSKLFSKYLAQALSKVCLCETNFSFLI